MHNKKDLRFLGKHDYDELSARRFASFGGSSFSVNIFKWGLKSDAKEMKPSKCVVRVSGSPANREKVFAMCDSIVNDLDKGIWDGRKTVSVK